MADRSKQTEGKTVGDIERTEVILRILADPPYGNTGRVVMGTAQSKATAAAIIAALDAAEARDVGVKPLVFSHGFSFGGQDHSHAESPFGPWTLTAYSGRFGNWAYTDSSGEDSEDDWAKRDDCEAAAQADYTARILSALRPASPLGAVAMKSAALKVIDPGTGDFDIGLWFAVKALPTTFTPAELLAAAAELITAHIKGHRDNWLKSGVMYPTHITAAYSEMGGNLIDAGERLTAALAPFARKGGQ